MLTGISTASLNGKLLTEDALKWIGDIGAQCAEVFLTTYSEYRPSFGDALLKAQNASGVRVTSVHTLNTQFEGQLFSRTPRQKRDAVEIFTDVLALGKEMGADCYVMHGPAQIKYMKYNTDYAHYAHVTDELDALCAEHGMRLTWENVHWAHYNHPDFITRLAANAKRPVHTTLDIKQAMQCGLGYEDYLNLMGDMLANVHICDFNAEGQLSLPLSGEFDFRRLFSQLHLRNYGGAVIVEVYDGSFERPEQLEKCYNGIAALCREISG